MTNIPITNVINAPKYVLKGGVFPKISMLLKLTKNYESMKLCNLILNLIKVYKVYIILI